MGDFLWRALELALGFAFLVAAGWTIDGHKYGPAMGFAGLMLGAFAYLIVPISHTRDDE